MDCTIEIYDNVDDIVFDRYTVRIGDDVFTMSENATSPNGLNQHLGTVQMLPGWRLGEKVSFESLPEAVQEAIEQRIGD